MQMYAQSKRCLYFTDKINYMFWLMVVAIIRLITKL